MLSSFAKPFAPLALFVACASPVLGTVAYAAEGASTGETAEMQLLEGINALVSLNITDKALLQTEVEKLATQYNETHPGKDAAKNLAEAARVLNVSTLASQAKIEKVFAKAANGPVTAKDITAALTGLNKRTGAQFDSSSCAVTQNAMLIGGISLMVVSAVAQRNDNSGWESTGIYAGALLTLFGALGAASGACGLN